MLHLENYNILLLGIDGYMQNLTNTQTHRHTKTKTKNDPFSTTLIKMIYIYKINKLHSNNLHLVTILVILVSRQ